LVPPREFHEEKMLLPLLRAYPASSAFVWSSIRTTIVNHSLAAFPVSLV
jgi:hypothetical protein